MRVSYLVIIATFARGCDCNSLNIFDHVPLVFLSHALLFTRHRYFQLHCNNRPDAILVCLCTYFCVSILSLCNGIFQFHALYPSGLDRYFWLCCCVGPCPLIPHLVCSCCKPAHMCPFALVECLEYLHVCFESVPRCRIDVLLHAFHLFEASCR